MCIIILKPKGKNASPAVFKACFRDNPDGAGYMYPAQGKVEIRKGFFTFESFLRDWNSMEPHQGNEVDVVFHFRLASHGRIDKTNCHPHHIADDLAFVHNGILRNIMVPFRSRRSDTIMYRNKYLFDMTADALYCTGLFKIISEHIGPSNKLIFMNGQGKTAICNEESGIWRDGIWYSKPAAYLV